MWLLMSVCLYVGAWLRVGYRLGSFASAALVCSGAALKGISPMAQLQLFLVASYTGIVVSPKVHELLDRF